MGYASYPFRTTSVPLLDNDDKPAGPAARFLPTAHSSPPPPAELELPAGGKNMAAGDLQLAEHCAMLAADSLFLEDEAAMEAAADGLLAQIRLGVTLKTTAPPASKPPASAGGRLPSEISAIIQDINTIDDPFEAIGEARRARRVSMDLDLEREMEQIVLPVECGICMEVSRAAYSPRNAQ